MTTLQIEGYADPGSHGTGDFNIQATLRYEIVPEFLEDVGYVTWRRRYRSVAIAAGDTYIDIPSTTEIFSHMKSAYLDTDFDNELEYIGEDPKKVLMAKAETTAAKPTGYFIESNGSFLTRVSFNCPCDAARTLRYEYDMHVKFQDATSTLDLDPYIPTQWQWALVEGLKREIHSARSGVGDPGYALAGQKFEQWKQRCRKSPEAARREKPKYAR